MKQTPRKNLRAVAAIFRGPFLRKVASGNHEATLRELLDYAGDDRMPSAGSPLNDFFEYFYLRLMEDYRCEYVFKNAIANNNPPNAGNRALLTGELSVGCSRVDIAVINGTSTAYEIKTEMDSVSRLEGQLKDYRKVFDRILVMVPPHLVEKYASITPSDIGLVSVSLAGDLIPVRESASHRNEVSASVLFDCMRQAEYIEIIRSRWGQVPSVPNSELYRECKKLFCQLLPFEAHDLMANQVRLRGVSKAKTSLIDAVPKSLKLSALTLTATETEIRKLLARLSAPFSPYETNRVSLPQRKAERIARTS